MASILIFQSSDDAPPRSCSLLIKSPKIGAPFTPLYDANGNTTRDETGKTLTYDAWNRLVSVNGTAVVHSYDALNRRVKETRSGTPTDLYYSAGWQVLEERTGTTKLQYVWSPIYVDAMVLRDKDLNSDGSIDERLYVQQDANFNVTAVVSTGGVVQERFIYDPYDSVTSYDAGWTGPL